MNKIDILTFVIGLLVGAIITTGVFLVIKSNDRPNMANFDRSSFPSSRRSNSEKTEDNTIEEKVEENNND